MNIQKWLMSEIKVREDRVINSKNIERLVKSIQEVGMLNPIFITEEGLLISGNHRFEAMKKLYPLPDETIECIVTTETDLAKLKIMEITDNMTRNGKYTAIEMCKMAFEARQAWIDQGLFNDGHKQKEGEKKLTNQNLADLTKVSKSTIKNYIRVWSNLTEKAREVILNDREKYSLKDLMELTATNDKNEPIHSDEEKEEMVTREGGYKAPKEVSDKAGIEAHLKDAEKIIAELTVKLEDMTKDRNAWKLRANTNGSSSKFDGRKLVKLIHPDGFQEALKGFPDLMQKLNDAMVIVNTASK